MKDSLKIALGIILGVLGLAVCSICAFSLVTTGGIALIGASLPSEHPSSEPPTQAVVLTPIVGAPLPPELPPSALPTETIVLTPQPTTVVPIQVGQWAQWGNLALGVTSFQVSDTCPGGSGNPPPGAKFVVVQVGARNDGQDVLDLPSLVFDLAGYASGLGTSGDCRFNEEAFGNACWQWTGKLYPDVSCEGWELFEVPEGLSVNDAILRVQEGMTGTHVSEWLLSGQ
jgi:hypothetical protein